MSATATAPAAPAPAGRRPRRRLEDPLRRHDRRGPPDRRPPGPGRLRPRGRPGRPACFFRAIAGHRGRRRPASRSTPTTADPAIPADRERYPVTWGALIHECAHAAHTRWSAPPRAARELVPGRPPAGRIPHRGPPGLPPPRRPPLAPRQRHQADPRRLHRRRRRARQPPRGRRRRRPPAGPRGRRHPRARRDRPGRRQGRGRHRHAHLARLRATWREFHATADDDLRTRTILARRWCRILGLDPDAAPPAPLIITIPSDPAKALARAIEVIAEAVAADFAPPPPPFPPDAAEKREHEKAVRGNAERAAARSSAARPGPGRSPAPATPAKRRPPPPAASPARCARPPPGNAPPSPSPRRSRPAASAWARHSPPGRSVGGPEPSGLRTSSKVHPERVGCKWPARKRTSRLNSATRLPGRLWIIHGPLPRWRAESAWARPRSETGSVHTVTGTRVKSLRWNCPSGRGSARPSGKSGNYGRKLLSWKK